MQGGCAMTLNRSLLVASVRTMFVLSFLYFTGSHFLHSQVALRPVNLSQQSADARGKLGVQSTRAGTRLQQPVRPEILERYGELPLSFERILGQSDPRVRFLSRGPGYDLLLTGNELVFSLHTSRGPAANPFWVHQFIDRHAQPRPRA